MIDGDYWEVVEILTRTVAIKKMRYKGISDKVYWFDKKFINNLFAEQSQTKV